jgi:hypothetical protein
MKMAEKKYEHPLKTVGRHVGRGALAGLGVGGVAHGYKVHEKNVAEGLRKAREAAKSTAGSASSAAKEVAGPSLMSELGETAHAAMGHPAVPLGLGTAALGAGVGAVKGIRKVVKATRKKEQEDAARKDVAHQNSYPQHGY